MMNRRRGGQHDDEGGNDLMRAEAEMQEEEAEMRDKEEEEAEAGNLHRAGGNNMEHDTGMRGNDKQERGRHDEESPVKQSQPALLLSLFSILNYIVYIYVGPNLRKASPSLGEYIYCTSMYV